MSSAEGPAPGIAGSWQLDGEDIWLLSIEQSGAGQWRVSAMVANNIGCSVTEENGVFSAEPVVSTMMMAPPELRPLETSVLRSSLFSLDQLLHQKTKFAG